LKYLIDFTYLEVILTWIANITMNLAVKFLKFNNVKLGKKNCIFSFKLIKNISKACKIYIDDT
jgi:hypothetical protein